MQVSQGQGQGQRNAEHRIDWPNLLVSLLESLLRCAQPHDPSKRHHRFRCQAPRRQRSSLSINRFRQSPLLEQDLQRSHLKHAEKYNLQARTKVGQLARRKEK